MTADPGGERPDDGASPPRPARPPRRFGAAIVGHIAVRDLERWATYVAGVPTTIAPWGAEVVMRGAQRAALNGVQAGTDLVVIRFPDLAAVHAWYGSEAYQALIPLRDAAADVVLSAYEI